MDKPVETPDSPHWLDKPVFRTLPQFKLETLLVTIILILAIFSRFYMLGERVMSHDEVNHVNPSFDLVSGRGYVHDPVTHGPFQFHAMALSYFLLGDSDFSSRAPDALFSVATIGLVLFAFRKYLGRTGALIAGFLFLISPYLLYYGRYTRNEAYVALYGVATLYAVLKYLHDGKVSSLYIVGIATAMQFITKETNYIYAAQLLIFLAFLFMQRIASARWPQAKARNTFLLTLSGALIILLMTLGLAAWNAIANRAVTAATPETEAAGTVAETLSWIKVLEGGGVVIAFALLGVAAFVLLRSIGWNAIKQERSFDLLILSGTLILPILTAFPVKLVATYLGVEWDPTVPSVAPPQAIIVLSGIFLVVMSGIAAFIGMNWKPRIWLPNFVIFYAISTVFYTTFFTNGFGFFTGIIGGLAYWLSQQGVYRGEQPFYYYFLIQIPIYEYLAAFGALVAIYFGTRHNKWSQFPGDSPALSSEELPEEPEAIEAVTSGIEPPRPEVETEIADGLELQANVTAAEAPAPIIFNQNQRLPVLALLVFWSISALFAYTAAGERMPWLTVHIAMPLLLAAGWGFGYLVDTTPWKRLTENRGWLALLLLPVFITSLGGVLGSVLGTQQPFQGNTLDQLRSTSLFIFSAIALVLSSWGILKLLSQWTSSEVLHIATAVFTAVLVVLTARTAYTASFINYDSAEEFLVFAHAARGPKDILAQVEEISRRTTRGLDIAVAYDSDANYPFWWYFRHYPNKRWFADNPTRDLQNNPIIIAGYQNWTKLDSITRGNYVYFEYNRLWWPMQDYYNLTWQRIYDALKSPQMRSALFQIWLNRDYTEYAAVTGRTDLTLANWNPSQQLRMYVRKDLIAQIWNYGASPVIPAEEQVNPYDEGMITLSPEQIVGASGAEAGQFQAPRGIAFAVDGSMYVADSRNNRIQQFNTAGEFVRSWGSFANIADGDAPGGTFYESWGIAVGPDGSVYVADTWNHRIQKFSADGEFLQMWGYFGQAEAPDAFWGPRDIAFDSLGRLYVTDTGNKRVVVFNPDGTFVTQFGTAGFDPGQFDEQVGIAINAQNEIFITDTWNQRVQVFALDPDSLQANMVRFWDVSAWYGSSLENKPYIAVDQAGHVFITDPEGYRVLEFTGEGEFVRGWGDYSPSSDGFGLPSGIEVDAEGRIWVSDAGNNLVLRFTLPTE
ncbi:MAG: glycosyltransferase family 39 protein [Bellilinea sp.]